jgi:hypothetical protein
VGGFSDANIRATVSKTGFRVNTSTASTSTTSGALIVDGGVGIGGNIHAAAINATPIGNTIPSTGVFTNLTATDVNLTTLVATNLSTGNVVISGGYIAALANASVIDLTATNLNSTNGNITTLVATNFSTANALVTGGYADNFPIGANTAASGNFTTVNVATITAITTNSFTINSTSGNIISLDSVLANVTTFDSATLTTVNLNVTTGNLVNANIDYANIGNLTLGGGTLTIDGINSVNGNILTLFVGNLSTANAQITGGFADNFPIGANTAAPGTFTTLTATTGNIITVNSTSANLLNATIGNVTFTNPVTFETINVTNSNITTLVANNFSSGNAQLTGGYADNFIIGPNIATQGNFTFANAVTFYAGNLTTYGMNVTSANIILLDANVTTTVNLNTTNGNITNLTSTTIDASTTTTATLNSTSANITDAVVGTLVSTNFSSGNIRVTGGYADNIPIGANTAATGAFTTLTASSSTTFTSAAQSDNSATGAVVVTGGLGVGANLNVGGNVTIQGNLTVIGNTTILNTENLNVEDKNITIAANATTPNDANGAGITIAGANATFTYSDTDDSWNLNKNLNLDSLKVVTANVTAGNIITLFSQNFSTSNARITGGNIDITNIYGNSYVQADNINSFNSQISNLFVVNANIISGNASLESISVIDFTSSNVTITGGNIDGTNIGTTIPAIGIFTTANANTINVQNIYSTFVDVTNGNITTFVANNFSTANAIITGGYADNFPIGANTAATGAFTTLTGTNIVGQTSTIANSNSTNGNVTTLVATNFSSGNVQTTGGYADNFNIGPNVAASGNFTNVTTITANATTINVTNGNIVTSNSTTINSHTAIIVDLNITNANISNLSAVEGNVTTLYVDNFSTSNAVISGGYISTLTNAYITTGNITNFSTANARITGGYLDGTPIGANTASTGRFTSLDVSNTTKTTALNVTGNVYLSPQSGPATVTIYPLAGGTMDGVSIGQTDAANVYASNFRTSTSLWAAPSGTVWIRGGTGTNGINNIPIGAVTPSSGVFTTVDALTVTGTTVNATNGNVTTLVATNFSSGNTVISGGYISALTNAYITLSSITNFSTGNARITGGFADNFPIGANIAATGAFTTLTAASLNGAIIGNAIPAAGTFTSLAATGNLTLATGNIVISSGNTTVYTAAAGTANTTGALVITGTGGAAINGNVYIGQGAVINGNRTTNDTIVRGVNERSLVYVAADATYDQVSIGGNITTANITQGAKLVVNSTDSLLIPVGTTAERPSGQGFTDVDGMVRYNTTVGELEFYGGGQWNITGAVFTVIQSRTFANVSGDINGNVDGANTEFTLGSESTTAATIVSINGVIQIPTTAYSVSGNLVTFTEAPAIGDVVDTRVLTTTGTVTGVTSLNGFNQFQADSTGLRFYTGNVSLGSIENWRIDTHGDFYPVTTANLGAPSNRIDYIFASNINIQGGTITGAGLSSGSLDDTVIGANIARAGYFTTLNADSTFTTNAEHVTDDIRGKFVAPSATDAVYGFLTSVYRSGKFFVQLSDEVGGEYQAAEVIAVHNGTTCSIEVYAVTFTGAANLATFSSNISGGTAYLNASSAGANLKIKVTPTLMKL